MANRPIEGDFKVSGQALDHANHVRAFFENAGRGFAVERIIGQGSWGFTLQMIMRSPGDLNEQPASSSSTLNQGPGLRQFSSPADTPPSRPLGSGSERVTRFVMKRSLAEVGEKNIRTEIEVLNRLRGCMHIAQPSHVIDDPRWNGIIRRLKGPTLLMEWVENGLLWVFYEKRSELDEPLPNRLLWALFLCLCRMVIGLTWPPQDLGRRPDGNPWLEVIPPPGGNGNRPPESRLLHGDFHGQNIMIDKLEPTEHKSIPVLKLIDFGMSRDLPLRANEPKGIVVKTNIRAIGEVMLGLLRGNVKGGPSMMDITHNGEPKRISSLATDLDGLSKKYGAPASIVAKHQTRIDNLDPEIRNLVALCVAVRIEDRPNIDHLLSVVERHAKNRRPGDYQGYKYAHNETDAAIERIVAEYMFDA